MRNSRVGILGAGIMGCCLALELARRGFHVDLYDAASKPMTGASLHNEGKLHLGFVYAKDPLSETHKIMIRGSLSFARILERLTGQTSPDMLPSEPFQYFIPNESQLEINSIRNHFHNVQNIIQRHIASDGDLYLNIRRDSYFEVNQLEVHEKYFSPQSTLGSFSTCEQSVSTEAVARMLTIAVQQNETINFIGKTKVVSVFRVTQDRTEVTTRSGGRTKTSRYPCVANCLWDDKIRIDKTAGITNTGPWILRYKAMLTISAPSVDKRKIPSATGILGPFGDIVNHGNGTYYISWYPLCKLAQTLDDDGRKLHSVIHKLPARGIKRLISRYPSFSELVSPLIHKHFIESNIYAMAKYVPAVKEFLTSRSKTKVSGGVILAKGSTDIDDSESYLHQRSFIGPVAYGGYVTIDTGKYCTAPLFALETADIIIKILS